MLMRDTLSVTRYAGSMRVGRLPQGSARASLHSGL